MARSLKLLLLEDNLLDADLILRELRLADYEVEHVRVDSERAFLQHLKAGWDVIISDYRMPQFDGFRALELAQAQGLTIPFILVAGTIGEEIAVGAMKRGATDYLLKDRLARLGSAVEHALAQADLKRAERTSTEALAQAESKYRSIFENSLEGIYQTSPEGRLLIANPTLARIAGYDSPEAMYAEVENVGTQLYVNLEDRRRYQECMLRDGFVNNFEAQMRSRSGRLFWISTNARAARDAKGNLFFEGALKDITERKQAEEMVQNSERRFRATLENLMEGCQIIGRNWTYLYSNVTGAAYARMPLDKIVGQSLLELYPGFEKSEIYAVLKDCFDHNHSRKIESEFSHPGGDSSWFQLVIQPIPEGLFVLSLDITGRKRSEQKIKGQLHELQRWQEVMLNREDRMQELKAEVNALLARQNQAPRYATLQPA